MFIPARTPRLYRSGFHLVFLLRKTSGVDEPTEWRLVVASHSSLDRGATRQPVRLAREVATETVQDVASAHDGHSQTAAGLIRIDFLAVSKCDMSDVC